MRAFIIEETEFKHAFEETLLKIEKALRENPREIAFDHFRTVNYYVRELQSRLGNK